MVILIILMISMVIMLVCLNYSYDGNTQENGKYILGIHLSNENKEHDEVKAIYEKYKKNKRKIFFSGLVTIFIQILFRNYDSFMLLYIFIWFLVLMIIYDKTLKKHSNMLYEVKCRNGWTTDDNDIYWPKGMKEPNTPFLKDKRVGVGKELNVSNKINYIIVIVILIFVLGLSIFLMRYDFAHITLNDINGEIKIEVAGEGISIDTNDIISVTFLDEMPDMDKNNGYNGTKFNIGNFYVKGYNNCKVYVCKKNNQAIVIETKQGYIVVNSESMEKTQEYYKILSKYSD